MGVVLKELGESDVVGSVVRNGGEGLGFKLVRKSREEFCLRIDAERYFTDLKKIF